MLGCVYLILAALLGREITHNFLPEQRMREKGITPLWVTFAASFGSGVLLMTWAVYIAAWQLWGYFCSCAVIEEKVLLGNLLKDFPARFLQRKKSCSY